jgi:hypothetical protein
MTNSIANNATLLIIAFKSFIAQTGNTSLGERLSTVDLLIMVACFVKKGK